MATEKLCFKQYITCIDDKKLTKTRRRSNKKTHKGRYYGGAEPVGESTKTFIAELLGGALPNAVTSNILQHTPNIRKRPKEEEQETRVKKIDRARRLFASLINQPNVTRQDVIQHMIDHVGVTQSTAVSYYERLAKEAGITNKASTNQVVTPTSSFGATASGGGSGGGQAQQFRAPEDEVEDEFLPGEERDSIIRTVKNAHLVFKRQTEDGSFEELWIYNSGNATRDEMVIRHDILAGTDIPTKKTKSPDGTQSFELVSLGNAQMLHITGLPN